MFTVAEKESRHRAVQQILNTDNLKALLLVGDTNAHRSFHGDFGYYTNTFTIAYRQVALVFPDSEAVLFAVSEFQKQVNAERSFVSNCRVSDNLMADAAKLLKERGVFAGRIGVNFEMLPSSWYLYLKQEFPQIEWVETHQRIMQIRFQRSKEEADIYRKGAALGDGGFEAAVKFIRPGVTEFEICSEIERYARARGAENHFTLIASGKFEIGDGNKLPRVRLPSSRRINIDDTIVMEITPRYGGYWTQLLRGVNVGKPNADLEKMYRICRDAITKGLEQFIPGKKVGDVDSAIESYVSSCGYVSKQASGHLCGFDLVEARLYQNEMVLKPGTAAIIHPQVLTPDGKNSCFCCGETYLVTQDGHQRLHKTGDELLIL